MIPMINGIFTGINYQFPEYLTITAAQLDILFITNWGMRTVAPIVLALHEGGLDSQLTTEELHQLGRVIWELYAPKWNRLKDIMDMEYDPIHNYSDTYHEELSEDIDKNDQLTHNTTETTTETIDLDSQLADGGEQVTTETSSGSSTRTDNLTEGVQASGTSGNTRTDNLSEVIDSDTANNIYGYNSGEPEGDTTSATDSTRLNTGTRTDSGTTTNTSTTTHTGTQGNSQSGSVETTIAGGLTHTTDETRTTDGTKRKTGTETDVISSERSRTRDFTHIGNIGNLTTQQLITQEIELWRWNFINEVLNDVKEFLTLPLYD